MSAHGRWFRAYESILNDPKLQRLSGDSFKGLVNLWCVASANGGSLPANVNDIAFALRMTPKAVSALLRELCDAGLLDGNETSLAPHNWSVRQFQSDVSTDRVKRHRERKKAVTGNGNETLHETPPDTDTDTEQRESQTRARELPSDWKSKDEKVDAAEIERFRAYNVARATKLVDWDAAWEVWKSRTADFGKANGNGSAKPDTPTEPMVWLSEDDPRWGKVAAHHRTVTGKSLFPGTSKHGNGYGAFVPADYPELAHKDAP